MTIFFSNLTGREYLDIFPATNTHFNPGIINRLPEAPLNDVTESYSAGMKKKLALMAVLKQDKPVFIFDELFNGLNLGSGRAPELIIQKLKEKEKTIFISFHVLAPRLTLCNGICLLQKGQFVKSCQQQDFAAANKYLFAAFSKQAGDIISASI